MMKRYRIMIAMISCICSFYVTSGFGHIISIEEQALELYPEDSDTEGDFSFENPFHVTRTAQSSEGDTLYIGPEESQAIFAYLTEEDYDVYRISVKPSDIKGPGEVPLTLSASALPPACQETLYNYPYTALLYPLSPEKSPSDMCGDLPFDVPDGYGVIIAKNPLVDDQKERPIFDLDTADPELELGISWFLPVGLTQECLLNAPWLCNYENTITYPVFRPGDYFIVIWSPDEREQDYTANIGFKEEVTAKLDQTDIQMLVKNNALLHLPCSVPYP